METEHFEEWVNPALSFAVAGASADPEKYGHRVFRDLLEAGYHVVPVNPKGGTLLGVSVAPSLRDVTPLPDIVVFVTKPDIAAALLPEATAMGIKKFWFQPGAASDASREWCAEHPETQCVFERCIMVVRRAIEAGNRAAGANS